MGKKPNLKTALSSQQNRLKQNSKAKESALKAQKQAQVSSKTSSKKVKAQQLDQNSYQKDVKGKRKVVRVRV